MRLTKLKISGAVEIEIEEFEGTPEELENMVKLTANTVELVPLYREVKQLKELLISQNRENKEVNIPSFM